MPGGAHAISKSSRCPSGLCAALRPPRGAGRARVVLGLCRGLLAPAQRSGKGVSAWRRGAVQPPGTAAHSLPRPRTAQSEPSRPLLTELGPGWGGAGPLRPCQRLALQPRAHRRRSSSVDLNIPATRCRRRWATLGAHSPPRPHPVLITHPSVDGCRKCESIARGGAGRGTRLVAVTLVGGPLHAEGDGVMVSQTGHEIINAQIRKFYLKEYIFVQGDRAKGVRRVHRRDAP